MIYSAVITDLIFIPHWNRQKQGSKLNQSFVIQECHLHSNIFFQSLCFCNEENSLLRFCGRFVASTHQYLARIVYAKTMQRHQLLFFLLQLSPHLSAFLSLFFLSLSLFLTLCFFRFSLSLSCFLSLSRPMYVFLLFPLFFSFLIILLWLFFQSCSSILLYSPPPLPFLLKLLLFLVTPLFFFFLFAFFFCLISVFAFLVHCYFVSFCCLFVSSLLLSA